MDTIDDVLARLDQEIATAAELGARWGYFPALYRAVTAEVKRAVEAGEFEDGPRMERLDVRFAVRYFDALDQWRAGAEPTRSWALALRAAGRDDLLVMQHLMLGMNAHINLDLALSAAEVAPGAAIQALREDFLHINHILARMVDGAQLALSETFPMLGRLDRLAGQADEALAVFSIERARGVAWSAATLIAGEPDAASRGGMEVLLDQRTHRIGRMIGAALPGGATVARLLEPEVQRPDGVRRAIEALASARRVEPARRSPSLEPTRAVALV